MRFSKLLYVTCDLCNILNVFKNNINYLYFSNILLTFRFFSNGIKKKKNRDEIRECMCLILIKRIQELSSKLHILKFITILRDLITNCS